MNKFFFFFFFNLSGWLLYFISVLVFSWRARSMSQEVQLEELEASGWEHLTNLLLLFPAVLTRQDSFQWQLGLLRFCTFPVWNTTFWAELFHKAWCGRMNSLDDITLLLNTILPHLFFIIYIISAKPVLQGFLFLIYFIYYIIYMPKSIPSHLPLSESLFTIPITWNRTRMIFHFFVIRF